MSAVPPNLVGPILQSHLAQHQVSGVRDNEDAHKVNANRQQLRAASQNDTTVETDDPDMQVHTDAEGSGSQGRAFSNPEEAEHPEQQTEEREPPFGDQGHHLDLQA